MKTASSALQAHMASDSTTLAYLWLVARPDGTIMGFTTHDQEITYDAGDGYGAISYLPAPGMANTAKEGKGDFSVDNLEVTAFLESDAIREEDIRAGLYDNAQIALRVVNWADLSMGHFTILRGFTGNIKQKNLLFTGELRGLGQKLTTNLGATYGELCRADLFSTSENSDSQWLCNLNRADYQQNGTLETVVDNRTLVPEPGLVQVGASPESDAPAGWFNDGIISFTSGALDGTIAEIKSWDGTTLVLFLSLPELPAPGDTFTIEPGCNKGGDCQAKFGNIINQRAEPFIPGMDQLLDYAS
jgi:uncharacterized phage protein (TIGR02218 family)